MKLINKIIIVLFTIIVVSCSSASARKWHNDGVAPEKRTWRNCTADRDKGMAGKGICYWNREWSWEIWQILKKRRRVHLFCKWGDLDCIARHRVRLIKVQ